MGKTAGIFMFTMLLGIASSAQTHNDFYTRSKQINQSGMYFLGGWAVANMALGTYGWMRYEGHTRYFHQMNAAWNLVNAGIATWALFDMGREDVSGLSSHELLRKHIRTENLYLINAGLDLLYMAGGAWMIHASSRSTENADMLKGYGQSVILQGTFLFLFDLTKFSIQYRHRQGFLQHTQIGLTPTGLRLAFSL